MSKQEQHEIQRLLTSNLDCLKAVRISLQTAPEALDVMEIISDVNSLLGRSDRFQVIAAISLLEQWGLVEHVGSKGPFTQHDLYEWVSEKPDIHCQECHWIGSKDEVVYDLEEVGRWHSTLFMVCPDCSARVRPLGDA